MSLQGAVDVLSDGERARYPGSLDIEAYFDGWSQASGGPSRTFPRYLTRDEEEAWLDGWNEAKAERAEYGDSVVIQSRPRIMRVAPSQCTGCPILDHDSVAA